MNYKIYKNIFSKKSSKKLFEFVQKSCCFYNPLLFSKKEIFKDQWLDKKFVNKMILFRKKYKSRFSAMYNSIQVSNQFQKIIFQSKLDSVAKIFLNINEDHLLIRGIQLIMDFPHDTRNSYGWHQDNAYDRYNLNSKNGIILWIPLVDTNEENGTLKIIPGSQYSSFNCSTKISKGSKYKSKQILVKKKFLKNKNQKSIDCKKNSALATYCGIFHKSGENISDHIRFTIIVRFNNQFSKDFLFYRQL